MVIERNSGAAARNPARNLLTSLITQMRTRNEEVRQDRTNRIRDIVEGLKKGSAGEFHETMRVINQKIFELVQKEPIDIWAGIGVIGALLDVVDTTAEQLAQLGNFVRLALRNADKTNIVAATKTLGRLAKKGGVLTSEHIEREARRAIDTLNEKDVKEMKLYSSILVVKELAKNAPALFYPHIDKCLKPMWVAIRDSNIAVREAGADSMRAVLDIISQQPHTSADRTPGGGANYPYHLIWEQCRLLLRAKDSSQNHGALLCVADIFHNSGPFLFNKFSEAYRLILNIKDSSNSIVRIMVLRTIPQMASYARSEFDKGLLGDTLQHLTVVIKKDSREEKTAGLKALAELSRVAGPVVCKQFPMLNEVRICIEKKPVLEALPTYAVLAAANPTDVVKEQVGESINMLYAVGGVSFQLADSLAIIAKAFPSLRQRIQSKLLESLSKTLTGSTSDGIPARCDDVQKALRTLREFDFSGRDLGIFVRDCIIKFLDDESAVVRREAALTCAAIVVPKSQQTSASTRGHKGLLVADIVERLLSIAVADSDSHIRHAIFTSLNDIRFSNHLVTTDNLRYLFMSVNDEAFRIRMLVTEIVAKLAPLSPSHVLPCIRRLLLQHISVLENSIDLRTQHETLQLLTKLINAAPKTIAMYIETVVAAYKLRMQDLMTDVDTAVSFLGALSATAQAVAEQMTPYLGIFLPLVISVLKEQGRSRSSLPKIKAALKSFGSLIQFTGYSIKPYEEYPDLVSTLFGILMRAPTADADTTNQVAIKRETVKVLGIIGALDPHRIKVIEIATADGQSALQGSVVTGQQSPQSKTKSEGYYITTVLQSLASILYNNSLQPYHKSAVQVLVNVGRRTLPEYHGTIIKPFIKALLPCSRTTRNQSTAGIEQDESTTKFYLGQLSALVPLCGSEMAHYLDDLHTIIHLYFEKSGTLPVVLHLISRLAVACPDQFKAYLPPLLPRVLMILQSDVLPDESIALRCLSIVLCIGVHLNEFLHQVIPAIINLVCTSNDYVDLLSGDTAEALPPYYQGLRAAALKTLRKLGRVLRLEDHASSIIHPLLRVLSRPDNASLRSDIMGVLCLLVYHLGTDYAIFIPIIHKTITSVHYSHSKYSSVIDRLLKNQPLAPYSTIEMDSAEVRYLTELLNVPLEEVPSVVSLSGDDDSDVKEKDEKLQVSQKLILKTAYSASNIATKDGWIKWLRSFSLELLQQSPVVSLRLCANLASQFEPVTRNLFNIAFVSIWNILSDRNQELLCNELERILTNLHLPPEVLTALLNLIEYMDANDMSIPIDPQLLSSLATKTSALAKTLRWKEIAYQSSRQAAATESLVSTYNQLGHHQSTLGVLHVAEKSLAGGSATDGTFASEVSDESWYMRLGKWSLALKFLEQEKQQLEQEEANTSTSARLMEIEVDMMRCLNALGEWKQLYDMAKATWDSRSSHHIHSQHDDYEEEEGDTLHHAIAPLATAAAWRMGDWPLMTEAAAKLPHNSYDYYFHGAILSLQKEGDACQRMINYARDCLAKELTAFVSEGYDRAYESLIQCQQLVELEEIRLVRQQKGSNLNSLVRKSWMTRLRGCATTVRHWDSILQVRTLLVKPVDDCGTWLKFIGLCRNQGQHKLEHQTLVNLLGHQHHMVSATELAGPQYDHKVSFAYFKHMWAVGDKEGAYVNLESLITNLKIRESTYNTDELLSRCCVKYGDWTVEKNTEEINKAMTYYKEAMVFDKTWYRAWHAWALANQNQAEKSKNAISYITAAIEGYIKSITLGPSHASVLQDILRLLTLWFLHGHDPKVEKVLKSGFDLISLDVWLLVIPQIIARVHTSDHKIADSVGQLLSRIGKEYPQSLVYPLTVCAKSAHAQRKAASQTILESMRQHSPALVEQCEFVSTELIRVAIIVHEQWHEGIEEASKLFFSSQDIEGMLRTLFPLHNQLRKIETLMEVSFKQEYGRHLQEAFEWCQEYLRTGNDQYIHQAWELYYSTYKKLRKKIPEDHTTLELQFCSPQLYQAQDLDIAVPGLLNAKSVSSTVRIKSFHPHMEVLLSKQRPRKMHIHGSDGNVYKFLLKGHEDLRLDERVMQLFGLTNALLQSDSATAMKTALQIQRYPVIPLNSNAGLIGWVDNCDTLHSLVKDYRKSKQIRINVEYQHMIQLCFNNDHAYELLPLVNKVELFEHMLQHTAGNDLYKVLWLQSGTAEVWLDRRTTYTLSLATMSMVGYILGLGDRHPNNLMLQRVTGKVVHIDFGDCFEVAMLRDKFPEKIPFRLTRMLISAMEVSGIEGNYRHTCEDVMRVLREHKGSVMAMLEAFVHDPLLQWRILAGNVYKKGQGTSDIADKNLAMRRNIITEYCDTLPESQEANAPENAMPTRKDRTADERELKSASVHCDEADPVDDSSGDTTHKGVQLLSRINDKLNGTDFEKEAGGLDINKQVDRLINQATRVENLCSCYIGWCPFW